MEHHEKGMLLEYSFIASLKLDLRLREGVGIATCNAAEYRAMILGMRYALKKGFSSIRIQGDSKLVCMQVAQQAQDERERRK
ncbi:hypothetical protein PIB30_006802 [Stylosanthes scabra]|uniref:RNase H type-1 domain-containing protein n=1 Tax=Stylosanthes scabra TaxID=79078 RepID=A0ABU6U3W8_9FABA|nr:hypothetical protein [Stylosanthes scabra]